MAHAHLTPSRCLFEFILRIIKLTTRRLRRLSMPLRFCHPSWTTDVIDEVGFVESTATIGCLLHRRHALSHLSSTTAPSYLCHRTPSTNPESLLVGMKHAGGQLIDLTAVAAWPCHLHLDSPVTHSPYPTLLPMPRDGLNTRALVDAWLRVLPISEVHADRIANGARDIHSRRLQPT